MRAVVITKYGDPDVLSIKEVEKPTPKNDEILVKVRATSLNRADLMQRRGLYQIRFRVLTTFLVSNFQERLNRVATR